MRNEMFLGGLWLRAECWPENFCIPSFFWSALPPPPKPNRNEGNRIFMIISECFLQKIY